MKFTHTFLALLCVSLGALLVLVTHPSGSIPLEYVLFGITAILSLLGFVISKRKGN